MPQNEYNLDKPAGQTKTDVGSNIQEYWAPRGTSYHIPIVIGIVIVGVVSQRDHPQRSWFLSVFSLTALIAWPNDAEILAVHYNRWWDIDTYRYRLEIR